MVFPISLGYAGVAIVISHDRKFLRESTDHIWHMEENTLRTYDYGQGKISRNL